MRAQGHQLRACRALLTADTDGSGSGPHATTLISAGAGAAAAGAATASSSRMTSGVGASTPSMRGNGASTSVGGATGCSRITAGLPGLFIFIIGGKACWLAASLLGRLLPLPALGAASIPRCTLASIFSRAAAPFAYCSCCGVTGTGRQTRRTSDHFQPLACGCLARARRACSSYGPRAHTAAIIAHTTARERADTVAKAWHQAAVSRDAQRALLAATCARGCS